MRKEILAGLIGALIVSAGCVKTVNERSTPAFPLLKDKTEARYERSVPLVFEATRTVLAQMGTIANETTFYTNAVIKTIEAKVETRKVWVRVEPVTPTVTSVKIQARTAGGGTDTQLIHEIDKRIALELATR